MILINLELAQEHIIVFVQMTTLPSPQHPARNVFCMRCSYFSNELQIIFQDG